MLYKIKSLLLYFLLLGLIVTAGCNNKASNIGNLDLDNVDNTNAASNIDTSETQKILEIEFWTWSPMDEIISKFEAENPDIRVKTKLFNYFELKDQYIKALTTSSGPDVLMFYSDLFALFTADGFLQDLLIEPFNASKYKEDFPKWEGGLSLDNKQLLSLTYSAAPQITLYREDVMKANGFPYEPEEFAKFIENPGNILQIARKLKQEDQYIFQWPFDLPNIVGLSVGSFDKDLNYIRQGELFNTALDISKVSFSNNMILYGNLWTDRGKEAIKNNKLVMILEANAYSINELERLVPEQNGLWKITKPALGVTAWQFDSRVAINAQSNNKEQAWRFMEYLVTHKYGYMNDIHSIPEYIPARKSIQEGEVLDAYLGNQDISKIFYELAENMAPVKLTPMDEEANSIFSQGIWKASEQDSSSSEDIKEIIEEINNQLR
ncbi:MAG: extracellular solute-binding protein [Clostridiaceae bacterium]|nr:extracellular solute-binding protein [Clostridiaceae bacterium]